MRQPTLTILAGSNGSGKSTLSLYGREEFQIAPVLDPDAVARSLRETVSGADSQLEAGKRVLIRAHELLQAQESFTVETTLSGSTYLKMAARAKQQGFQIILIFVGTNAVEINLERVRARVMKGGHDVPEQDQRRRFPRTLANLRRLLPLTDLAVLLDNSQDSGYEVVGYGNGTYMHWKTPVPRWAEEFLAARQRST